VSPSGDFGVNTQKIKENERFVTASCHKVVYHHVAKSIPMSEGHGLKKQKLF